MATTYQARVVELIQQNTTAKYYPLNKIGTGSIDADNPGFTVQEIGIDEDLRSRLRLYMYVGTRHDDEYATLGLSSACRNILEYVRKIAYFPAGVATTPTPIELKQRVVVSAAVDIIVEDDIFDGT